jgi:hypothetical protein
MIDTVLRLNGCSPLDHSATGYTVYSSTTNAETAVYLHDNGHRYATDATALMVTFFKAHVRGDSRFPTRPHP